MPIDPSIAMGYRGVTPPDQLAQYAQVQQILGAQQANQLNQLKMAQAQQELESANALRAAGKDASGKLLDLSTPEGQAQYGQNLLGTGNVKAYQEFVTGQAAQTKAEREARTAMLANAKAKSEQYAAAVSNLTTPDDVVNWYTAQSQDPDMKGSVVAGMKPEDIQKEVLMNSFSKQPDGSFAFDPAKFNDYRQRLGIGLKAHLEELDKAATRAGKNEPKLGTYQPGDYTTASWAKFTRTQNPDDLKLKPTATEQKAVVEANLPDLTPKEIQKREAAYPKASASYRAANQEIDSLITDLKTLRDHSGLEGITGVIKGRTPGVTSQARAAEALLEKIQSRGQFRTLQEMRMNSPTGGALGNVSDFEGRSLRSSFGALDRRQATEDFQKQIDNTISDLQNSKQNIAQAYEDTYSYKQGNAPAAGAAPAGGAPAAGKTSKGATTSNW